MIYNKIEQVLVITKQIFNYYNTYLSLEEHKRGKGSSEIEMYTYTDQMQHSSLFIFSSTITEWNA